MTGRPGVGASSAVVPSSSVGASATGASRAAATEAAASAPADAATAEAAASATAEAATAEAAADATGPALPTPVGGAGGSLDDRDRDLVTCLESGRDLGLPPGCDADLHGGLDGLAVRDLLDV